MQHGGIHKRCLDCTRRRYDFIHVTRVTDPKRHVSKSVALFRMEVTDHFTQKSESLHGQSRWEFHHELTDSRDQHRAHLGTQLFRLGCDKSGVILHQYRIPERWKYRSRTLKAWKVLFQSPRISYRHRPKIAPDWTFPVSLVNCPLPEKPCGQQATGKDLLSCSAGESKHLKKVLQIPFVIGSPLPTPRWKRTLTGVNYY